MMHKLEVDLVIAIDGGSVEHSWPKLIVEYRYIGAYSGWVNGEPINPPEPEHCELGNTYVVVGEMKRGRFATNVQNPVPQWQIEPMSEALEALCLQDYLGRRDDALERQAEARREDDMLDRIERRPQAAE